MISKRCGPASKLCSVGDTIALLPKAIRSLNEIFSRQETVAFVVQTLKKAKPADLYPSQPEHAATGGLRTRLEDLVGFEGTYGWSDNRDVARARGVLRRVLNGWIKEVPVSSLDGAGLSGISEFPVRDASRLEELKAEGQSGSVLEDALDETLAEFVASAVNWRAPAPGGVLGGPLVAGGLDLRLCLRSYVRLQELFLGYPLTG